MSFLSGQTKLSGVGRAGFHCTCSISSITNEAGITCCWKPVLPPSEPGNQEEILLLQAKCCLSAELLFSRVLSAGLTFGMSYGKGCKRVLNFGL